MKPVSILRFISIIICILLFREGQAQTQKPEVHIRVAYLDHSKLRREYSSYASSKTEQLKKFSELKAKLQRETDLEKESLSQQVAADSAVGGTKRKELQENSAQKIRALEQVTETEKRKIHDENLKMMQDFERKIASAIGDVVREKGYNDVRPVGKDTPKNTTDDITNLVLQKLN
ncbi:OmpH family outer membrane protein [Flavitalea antarctica]